MLDPSPVEPIRMSVRVRRSVDEAFRIFTGDMTRWWPLDRLTFGPGRSSEVLMEPYIGGRFYERYRDGEEHTIGHVLEWQPPSRVAFTWQAPEWTAPTEIIVCFIAEDARTTRVELEHRGWERLGAIGLERRDGYLNGWPAVLGNFVQVAGRADDSESETTR